ncbi:VirB4 family type IV secretion/conjugal transfer ATPase [Rosenbergiella nectarea]|uniref:VirB4 family type IV secretion/conjugal transfer ATPase n=1 Tax=Rosenbergiella nectarea TaxID=988801 RepID=UPI001F4EF9D8
MSVSRIFDSGLFKKERAAEQRYLPYSWHLTDHIISLSNGDLLACFKIEGRTHECASDRELITWHRDLNNLVKSFANDNIELWTHEYHHPVEEYPQQRFDHFFADYLDQYNHDLHTASDRYVNDLYLSVIYRQPGDKTQKFLSRFEKSSPAELQDLQAAALAGMQEICGQIAEGMQAYGVEPLGIYYRTKRGEKYFPTASTETLPNDEPLPHLHAYSSALELLYFLVNLEWSLVPVCSGKIGSFIMDNRVISSLWGDIIQLRAVDHNFYTTAIEIRDYDKATEPGQLNLLKEADFSYLLTQSFTIMSELTAKTLLEHQEKSMLETKDRSLSQLSQLGNALDMLLSKEFVMGNHHATLHVFDADEQQVQHNARKAKVLMTQCGLMAGNVSLASEAAYFAKLPGNQHFRPRPVPINSWNFLHLSPFHNFMRGKAENNPWGPAVTLLRTVSGTPLYFNFHATPIEEDSRGKRPLGHTLILGRSGAGKTTVLNFLLAQSMKFSPRLFCYDRDRGMEPFIRSVGGLYTTLQTGVPSGFCPLQLAPTPRNISFVKNLLRVCVETLKGSALSSAMATAIYTAVDAVMDEDSLIPHAERNISALLTFVEDVQEQSISLCSLVKEWTRQGEYGWLFDNPNDQLDLHTNDVYGFDLKEFISEGENNAVSLARTPLLMYLLYRIRQSIDGSRRVIQCFDEFHAYLDDQVLEEEVRRGIKTDRKKDAVYIFATQEPTDALDSNIGKTIVQQTVTKLCLENPDADEHDYLHGLKLTEAEFSALRSIPENSRQFLVKQGLQSALATLDLRPRADANSPENRERMENILSILSGTPDNAERIEGAIAQYGDAPQSWLPAFWKNR